MPNDTPYRQGSSRSEYHVRLRETPLAEPAWEVALLYPPQGAWTAEEYLHLTDGTNRLIEFTAGRIEVLPVPTDRHQTTLLFIYQIMSHLVWGIGGKTLVAPLRLYITRDRYREPDILLVRDKHDPRRGERYWAGADLVVEIVSPDDPDRDWVTKRNDYADAGILEYWIVDAQRGQIAVLRLDDGAYREHGLFARGESATSALLPGLVVNVSEALDAE